MVSRCWVKCCLNAVTSIMPMSSARMLSSYHVARMDLNMAMDHAQLCCEDPTAAVQDSMAISLYMVPAGMSARLFQNLATRKSQTCCNDLRPSSARRMSVEVLPLTPVISLRV